MKKIALLMVVIMALVFSGCSDKATKQQESPKSQIQTEIQKPAAEKVKVTLYFANDKADALVPEVRQIDKPNDMIVALINELKNPGKYAPVLPKDTELIFYQKEGDTIVLNFNKAFANLQGTAGELMAVNSVANTITEQTPFKKVKLLVERQPLTTGHAVYDKPIPRNESIIKK